MKRYCLEVSGDYACFTRPEMKVERVSYDVITPSAARAVFEAILWKPAVQWHIRKVEVLKPVRWMNLRRNEVASVVSVSNVKSAMTKGTGQLGLNIEDDRQQRAGLFLRDVAYRLHADMEFIQTRDQQGNARKYEEMFERRAQKGQCVNQPYLGCREFAAHFRLVEDPEKEPPPIGMDEKLGYMLHDLDFSDPSDPQPRFFRAEVKGGVMEVPELEHNTLRA
jgi:CRISPR-associated protein Cas5d